MNKTKKIVSFMMCLLMILAMSITAFADSEPGISPCSDNSLNLENDQRICMSHGDVAVRSYAGIPSYPADNRVGTLYKGDWITVLVANHTFADGYLWSAISADKGIAGHSASKYLY